MGARRGRRVPAITLRLACAQLRARPLAEARAALQDILSAIREAKRKRADLVVLPECSYPGYVLLGDPYRRAIPSASEALRRVSAAAAQHGLHVALGIARHANTGLQNQSVLIDDGGREVGSYAKSYLWSFDNRWFVPGRTRQVSDTRFGSLGMMICADGRVPEITRELAAQGAWLILDPTAWVGYGPSYETMPNPQADFMLRVRALESNAWIAAADKCGSEHEAIYYVGRSQIVAPDGSAHALAGAAEPEVIVAEIARPRSRSVFKAPNAARVLTPGSAGAPASLVWLGVYQAPRRCSSHERQTMQALSAQGATVVLRTDASPAQLRATLRSRCPSLRSACIEGRALLAPESARAAARGGIDLLVWLKPPQDLPVLDIARTRALESRIYVLVAARPRTDVSACLVDPNGTVVAAALRNAAGAFVAPLDPAAARRKLVVPGTTVFEARRAARARVKR